MQVILTENKGLQDQAKSNGFDVVEPTYLSFSEEEQQYFKTPLLEIFGVSDVKKHTITVRLKVDLTVIQEKLGIPGFKWPNGKHIWGHCFLDFQSSEKGWEDLTTWYDQVKSFLDSSNYGAIQLSTETYQQGARLLHIVADAVCLSVEEEPRTTRGGFSYYQITSVDFIQNYELVWKGKKPSSIKLNEGSSESAQFAWAYFEGQQGSSIAIES